MATVKTIVEKAYTKVNGEYESLTETSDDFKTYLNVLNQVMLDLAHTPYVKWQIFFDMEYDLPDVVADGTLKYVIPGLNSGTVANTPYDHVFFVDGSGIVVAKYKMIDQAKFQQTNNTEVCAVLGDSLYLKATPAKILGTTIRLPFYKEPTEYTLGSQQVVIDSVPWLVKEMSGFICDASPVPFIARNAANYHKEAAISMKEMKDNNRRTQLMIKKSLADSTPHTWADVMDVMTMKDL